MKNVLFLVLLLFSMSGCMVSQDNCCKLLIEAESQTFDVIVVPGIPYENGDWDMVMRGRVYWSKYLYDRGIAKNIMYSGSSVYSPYYEAKIMALYAQKLGVPDSVIYTEIRAEHSTENIYYSYKKSKNLGFDKIALATDPFQTKMLRSFIKKKVDPSIALIPFVIDTLRKLNTDSLTITINDSSAFNPNFVSIKERESFWKRLSGTRGHNLNESYYSDGKLEDEGI
ncbi:YdcF family protein [Reichenbachiella agarivorans]|uniref:YdcF family protein n=1 Tax=Reichenbachiella agarivorans TaxID=2979464 RepID=A0ABY6CKC0_9BACT|nr:YdcF family protein [Reichenbachiella agarivorans]UXP30965.1 YdcF family protein [Reichenbachiella agarivorans]